MATVISSIERTCSVREWPKELPPEALVVWLLASEKLPVEIAAIIGCSREKVVEAIAALHRRKLLQTVTAQVCYPSEKPAPPPPTQAERMAAAYRPPVWYRCLDTIVVWLCWLERHTVYKHTARYVHWKQRVVAEYRLNQSQMPAQDMRTRQPTLKIPALAA